MTKNIALAVSRETRGTIERFESKDGREVEKWLEQRLAKRLKADKPLDWKPVIRVQVSQQEEDRRNRDEERGITVSGAGAKRLVASTVSIEDVVDATIEDVVDATIEDAPGGHDAAKD